MPTTARRIAAVLPLLLWTCGGGCDGGGDDGPRVDPALLRRWTLTSAEIERDAELRVLDPQEPYAVEFTPHPGQGPVPVPPTDPALDPAGSLLLSIDDGCNHCSGRYRVGPAGALDLSVETCTDVFCSERPEIGRELLGWLQDIGAYEVAGPVLRLRGAAASGDPLLLRFSPDPEEAAELAAGQASAIGEMELAVAQDVSSFAALWERHCPDEACGRPVPSVDFTRFTVLAAFAGSRPSTGYTVGIEGVDPGPGAALVRVLHAEPGPGCFVAPVLTRPHQFLRVSKIAGSVQLAERTAILSCE